MSSQWHEAAGEVPGGGAYVLGRAPSGYVGHPWRYFTCQFNEEFRAWFTVSGDRVTDSGEDVTEWRWFDDLEED